MDDAESKMEKKMSMTSFLIYWRSMKSKPGLAEGQTIPRFETVLPPVSVSRKQYLGLRLAWDLGDYGVLPPLYPAFATFMTQLKHLSDPKFPFQAMGTVHIRTVVEQVRVLRLDDKIAYRCSVEGHRVVDRGVEFDMVVEAIVDHVVASTTTMTMYRRTAIRLRDRVRPAVQVHNHITAHESSWDVTQATARTYARLSGDINPIHLSVLTARVLGFKAMMLHGIWIVGRSCAMHPIQMMADNIRLESEFKSPVLLPSTLRYRWWDVDGVLEMRVLDKNGVKPHMTARLTTIGSKTKAESPS